MNRPLPPPWMRSVNGGRHSPAMQRIYFRRRLTVGLIGFVILALIVYLVTQGGGGHSKVGTKSTTTTAPKTTTTLPMQLVATEASWHLPVPLSRSVVLPINSDLGIFGGLSTTATNARIYQIDPTTGTPTVIGAMPVPVHNAGGAVIGSSYYVFGGGATTETAAVQQFSFTSSTQMKGSVVANLPAKRTDLGSASVNGQVYLVGGFDGKAYLPSILSTSDGMTFTTTGQLNPAVRYPAVAVLNGMLYVIGGEVAPNAADATTVQQVNLATGTVTALTPLPVGLSHAAAVTLNNTIYVLGGRSGGHAINTISQLNPATGQLQTVGQLPIALSDMGVGMVGQTAYLVGGEGDSGRPVNTVITVALEPAGSAGSAGTTVPSAG